MTRRHRMNLIGLLAAAAAALTAFGAGAEQRFITVASTTSTENSGLTKIPYLNSFDVLYLKPSLRAMESQFIHQPMIEPFQTYHTRRLHHPEVGSLERASFESNVSGK